METISHQQHHDTVEGRPYRSHLHPACIPCRTRKSRCKTTHTSRSCLMCQSNGTDCVFPQATERPRRAKGHFKTPSKRISATVFSPSEASRIRNLLSPSPAASSRELQPDTTPRSGLYEPTNGEISDYHELPSPSTGHHDDLMSVVIDSIAKSGEGSSHVVSPAIADDDKVFQEYLSNTPYGQSGRTVRFHPNSYTSTGPSRPIVFNTIPKRGSREAEGRAQAASECASIEQTIEPYRDELINL